MISKNISCRAGNAPCNIFLARKIYQTDKILYTKRFVVVSWFLSVSLFARQFRARCCASRGNSMPRYALAMRCMRACVCRKCALPALRTATSPEFIKATLRFSDCVVRQLTTRGVASDAHAAFTIYIFRLLHRQIYIDEKNIHSLSVRG